MIHTHISREDPWIRDLQLRFIKQYQKGDEFVQAYVSKIEWKQKMPDEANLSVNIDPLTMDTVSAQNLMDALWHAGLRPSEGTGSAGAMAATQKHLEDMRKLVFK